jgi:hypothetical protein
MLVPARSIGRWSSPTLLPQLAIQLARQSEGTTAVENMAPDPALHFCDRAPLDREVAPDVAGELEVDTTGNHHVAVDPAAELGILGEGGVASDLLPSVVVLADQARVVRLKRVPGEKRGDESRPPEKL